MGNKLNQQFGLAQGDYNTIMGEGKAQADMTIQGQTAKRNALMDRLKLAIENEDNIEKKRQWQATYDQAMAAAAEQRRQADRTFAESQRQFNVSSAQKASSSGSSQPTLQQALNALGSSFKSGSGTARFYTGKDSWKTREQAAYDLASAANVDYKTALNAIYKQFKTKEGK
jgi:hypothetical protein